MGETYGAELNVHAIPRDWLMLEEVASPNRPGGTELEMRGWAQPWVVAEHDDGVFCLESAAERVGPLGEEAAYAIADDYNHRGLAEAWESVVADGGDVSVDVEEHGEDAVDLTVVDGMASYGITQWYDEGHRLDELLRAAGLGFEMRDDGKYEVPGELRWWRPGLPAVRAAVNAGEAGIVITRGEVIAIIRAHRGDPATIVALIAEWLDITHEEMRSLCAEG